MRTAAEDFEDAPARLRKDPSIPLRPNSDNVRRAPPIGPVLLPFQRFVAIEAAGGIMLLVATLVAIVSANSPWATHYLRFWHTDIAVSIGGATLSESLAFWINDGLMAVFFFVIGLEIKRELMVGELASRRQAVLPIAAAAGGAAVPAGIFAIVAAGSEGSAGWGIPMATDTAFALAILALLGSRVPVAVTVFVTALAIFDDVVALAVIALFYSENIAWTGIAAAGVLLAVLAIANRVGLRHSAVYAVLGGSLWLALLHSGIHPTLAGILLAAMTPAWSHIGTLQFLSQARTVLHRFEAAGGHRESVLGNSERQSAFLALGAISERAATPLQRLEHNLHPWTMFGIMPLFALANAGLPLGGVASGLTNSVGLGVVAGLVLGKPLGIVAGAWVAVRSRRTALPAGVGWRHIAGVGCLGGIGFTMSLFVADLAFGGTALLPPAKAGILAGSIVSGTAGWAILRAVTARQPASAAGNCLTHESAA